MALRRITAQDVDELRMPPSGQYGGDPRGAVDPAALLAASWQTPYDVDARRAAITKALLDQQAAQQVAAAAPVPTTPRDAAGMGTSPFDYKDIAQGTAGGPQPGDASNVSIDALFGARTPSYDEGRPPAPTPATPTPATPTPTPEPETGRGRVSVTPTPQSIRDEDQNTPQPDFPGGVPTPGARTMADMPPSDTPVTPENTPQPTTPNPNELPSVSNFATPNVFSGPPAGNVLAPAVGYNVLGQPAAPNATPTPTSTFTPDFNTATPNAGFGKGGFGGPGEFGREGTAGGPGAPGQGGKGSVVSDDQTDQALADLTESMQAINEMGRSMTGAPPAAPSDYDFGKDEGGKGPFDPGGPGYSPGAALAAGAAMAAAAPSGYGGRSGFAGAGLADMVGAMTAPGMPSPGGGTFDPGWGDVDLGDLGAPGAADTAGLTDTGPMGGDFSPSAADMAAAAPGGIDMGGSATGGNAGPGMGMSEGAAAAAAAAADAAAAAAAAEGEGGGQEGGGDEGGAAP